MSQIVVVSDDMQQQLRDYAAAMEMTPDEVVVRALRSYFAPALSPDQSKELARRAEQYRRDPQPGISWAELDAELRQRER